MRSTAERYAPGMRNGGQEHFDKVHGGFDGLMEQIGLPAEAREGVKATLDPEGAE